MKPGSQKKSTCTVTLSAIALFALLSSSACVGFPDTNEEKFRLWKRQINTARKLHKKGKIAEAEAKYKEALKLISGNREGRIFQAVNYYELGLILLEKKQESQAKELFDKSAVTFAELKKTDSFMHALFSKQHFELLIKLADLEEKQGDIKAAGTHLKEALLLPGEERKKDNCRVKLSLLENAPGKKYSNEIKALTIRLANTGGRLDLEPLAQESRKAQQSGETETAKALLEAFIDYAREQRNNKSAAEGMLELFYFYLRCSMLNKAEEVCDNSLSFKNRAFKEKASLFLAGKALLALLQADRASYRKFYLKALESANTDISKSELRLMLERAAKTELALKHTDSAEVLFSDALSIAKLQNAKKDLIADLEIQLAMISILNSDANSAQVHFEQALKTADSRERKFQAELGLTQAALLSKDGKRALQISSSLKKKAYDEVSQLQALLLVCKAQLSLNQNAEAALSLLDAEKHLPAAAESLPQDQLEMLEAEVTKLKKQLLAAGSKP